jgi:hypothetical protein
MPWPLFTPGKDTVPIVQEAGWAPGLVWTGAENLAPTGIRSPDHPARSQSLYRLRYKAHAILRGQPKKSDVLTLPPQTLHIQHEHRLLFLQLSVSNEN